MEKYWRIRMKPDHDLSKEAWELSQVGVWYGASTAGELSEALKGTDDEALESLSSLNKQRGFSWSLKKKYVQTARRFAGIERDDWVLV